MKKLERMKGDSIVVVLNSSIHFSKTKMRLTGKRTKLVSQKQNKVFNHPTEVDFQSSSFITELAILFPLPISLIPIPEKTLDFT